MRIGEVAEASGVSVRSLRYYEELGLISSARTPGGWRDFAPEMVERVITIQHLLAAGLSGESIGRILPCLRAIAEERTGEMEQLIAENITRLEERRRDLDREIDVLRGLQAEVAEAPDAPTGSLHPLLAGRYSPIGFDPDHMIAPDAVLALLEAARRAPSAGNSQPWRFVVAVRGTAEHASLLPHLSRSSSAWAPSASLLMLNLAQTHVDDDAEIPYSEFALYDLGQAVAHLTVQARAMGLQCHQFRAFDLDGIRADLAIPPRYAIASMTAVGRATHGPEVTGPGTSRERKEVAGLRWPVG